MSELLLNTENQAERTIRQNIRDVSQGMKFIGGDIAVKTIVSPMKNISSYNGTILLPGKKGISYYLYMVSHSMTMAVNHTHTSTSVTATVDSDVSAVLTLLSQTLTAQSFHRVTYPCILTDENTSVNVSVSGTETSHWNVIAYREVQQNAIPR